MHRLPFVAVVGGSRLGATFVAEHPEVKGLEQYRDLSNKTALQIEAYLAQLQ